MFNKVFKYDFKFVFRFWWIFALITLGLSAAGGFLVRSLAAMAEAEIENFLATFLGVLGIMGVIIALCVFPFVGTVANLVRYYKNFFSDEGYLTFTLPVSRATLLNSKVLCAFLFNLMSTVILILDLFLFLMIGVGNIFPDFQEVFAGIPRIWTTWLTIDVITVPLLLVMSSLAGICMTQLSITIGSVISKRHKVLTGIGIYILFTTAISSIQQLISFLTINPLFDESLYLSEIGDSTAALTLYLLVLTLFYTAVAVSTYFVNLHCIKHKLNLA